MTMDRNLPNAHSTLIDQMTAELEPVRPLKLRDGMLMIGLAVMATVLVVEFVKGLWVGGLTGNASAFFIVTNGLLLILGIAATVSAVSMASPRVGNHHEGPIWALAMAGVIPAAALVTLLGHDHGVAAAADPYGVTCMVSSLVASVLTATALVVWLRRGAPVSPNMAGLNVGVAAGALGSVAYGLSCPVDSVLHLGVWHSAPVIIGAIVGRIALPPILRW